MDVEVETYWVLLCTQSLFSDEYVRQGGSLKVQSNAKYQQMTAETLLSIRDTV